jgi:ABC-type transporter Mla subunit MlaD
MAKQKYNELTAGLFVIASLVTLVGVIVWLGGAEILRPTGQTAVFYAAEATGSVGLLVGGFVQVGDDQVGKIDKIRFEPDVGRTLYYADISRGDFKVHSEDFKVHSDGKARVAAGLIGGARLIIVDRGTDKAPLADDEHPIELGGGMDQTMSDLATAAEKVSGIADVIKSELDKTQSDAVLAKVHTVIESLKSAAADVAKIAANIRAETDAANEAALLAKIHSSVDDVKEMTADAAPKISDTLTAARDAAQKIRKYTDEDIAEILTKLREANTHILKITKNFSKVSEQVKQIVVLNRDNIDEMLDNMTQVSANLKATSKEVRRNPWRLLYQPEEKELRSQNIYDAARAFSNGAEQLDQAITRLTSLAKVHPEGLPTDDPEIQKVREQLTKSFENFAKVEQALWKELK